MNIETRAVATAMGVFYGVDNIKIKEAQTKQQGYYDMLTLVALMLVQFRILKTLIGWKWSLILMLQDVVTLFDRARTATPVQRRNKYAPIPKLTGQVANCIAWIEQVAMKTSKIEGVMLSGYRTYFQMTRGLYTDRMSWKQAIRRTKPLVEDHISEYWDEKGLKEVVKIAPNLNIVARRTGRIRQIKTKPYQSTLDTAKLAPYFEPRRLFTSLQDDTEFVRMVKKRLAGRVADNDVQDPQYIRAYKEVRSRLRDVNQTPQSSDQQYIKKALSTRGSSGRFLKHTKLQAIIKDGNISEVMAMWENYLEIMRDGAYTNVGPVGTWTTYEIYLKPELLETEAMEIAEDDQERKEWKVTRLLQAPQLPLRVIDMIYFTDDNDAYVETKKWGNGMIGLKYYGEIPAVLARGNTSQYDTVIQGDFSNYDGSQSPAKMQMCKEIRMDMTVNNKSLSMTQKIIKLLYLEYRYNLHIHRICQTNFHVKIEVIGGLASGDITTSDDNTMRTEIIMTMMANELQENGLAVATKIMAAGDDFAIKVKTTKKATRLALEEICNDCARRAGLTLKFLLCEPIDNIEFLSVVSASCTALCEDGRTVQFNPTIRAFGRHYLKQLYSNSFDIAAQSRSERGKAVAKLMSYMALSAFMPLSWFIGFRTIRTMLDAYEPATLGTWLAHTINISRKIACNPEQLMQNLIGFKIHKICTRHREVEMKELIEYHAEIRRVLREDIIGLEKIELIKEGGIEFCETSWDPRKQGEALTAIEGEYEATMTQSEKENYQKFMKANLSEDVLGSGAKLEIRATTTTCQHRGELGIKMRKAMEQSEILNVNRLYTCGKCSIPKEEPNTTLIIIVNDQV